ncbi:MAG: NUDIX domain-containing protein [Candidatus Paceibacterota bacterium]
MNTMNAKTELATVVYLLDERGRVCLAQKVSNIHKQGIQLKNSANVWNGYGGKKLPNESLLQTAIRELFEESGVRAYEEDLCLVAKINFFWPDSEDSQADMTVYFFTLIKYKGIPQGKKEMRTPHFFAPDDILNLNLLPVDRIFLPRILKEEKLVWDVYLGKRDKNNQVVYKELSEELDLPT